MQWMLIDLTDDEHLLCLDERVEAAVGNHLTAVGAAIHEAHRVQVQRSTGGERILENKCTLLIVKRGNALTQHTK